VTAKEPRSASGRFQPRGYCKRACDSSARLRHQPTKGSKSGIKRLRGFSHPQYRLRVRDDIRVFYDVTEEAVQVLAIVPKSDADAWLAK
jgi:hypothetical protein